MGFLTTLLGATAGHLAAQDSGPALQGWVVEEIWLSPMAGADVVLMDEGFQEIERGVSDGEGHFRLPLPPPGTYLLQARREGYSSPAVGPLEVGPAGEPEESVLKVLSARALAVVQCLKSHPEGGTGVVLGVAHESGTGMPLPGARIFLRWKALEGISAGNMEAVADDGGRFYLCGVPAGVPFDLRLRFLGQESFPQEGEVEASGSVVRADVPFDLAASELSGRLIAISSGQANTVGVLSGVLIDATTGRPVQGALVRIQGDDRTEETNREGAFRFESVEEGRRVLEVQHLSYGVQTVEVDLPGGAGVQVDLRVTPRALELQGIDVTAHRRALGDAGMARPLPMRALAGERLALLDHQGVTLISAIRQIGAGLTIHEGNRPDQACVEATHRATGMEPVQGCQMVVVVIDGVEALDPIGTLSDLRLADIESIEYLSPLEAGFRYGLEASARGALVVWSRGSGPYRSPERSGGGRAPQPPER